MSDRGRSSRLPTLGEFIGHEARHAVHDVRQKLFEEAWFGRVVTAAPVVEISRDAEPRRDATFDELWGRPRQDKHEPHIEPPEREIER